MAKEYYSARLGFVKKPTIDLSRLRELLLTLHCDLSKKGHFQEYFGYYCVDEGHVYGRWGSEDAIQSKVFMKLGKDLWPFNFSIERCNENEIFDIIELFYDHVSAPKGENGWVHKFNDCGWHFKDLDLDFDKVKGQKEFLKEVNEILELYSIGYQLNEQGEIISIADKGFETLLEKDVPFNDDDLESRMNHAILIFRNRHSTVEQRRDALRNLGDILEKLRDEAKLVLTEKDESDIFHLLNQFGIRHNQLNQKTNYDQPIFFSWMFYYFVASIHACQRLINRSSASFD